MRNFNSSLASWIGIIIVSLAWCACNAHPDGGVSTNPTHLLIRRGTSFTYNSKDDLTFDFPRRLYYPTAKETTLNIRNAAKRHVSINTKNIKLTKSRIIRDTSSIDESDFDESDKQMEANSNSNFDIKILDDLPETFDSKQTIEEEKEKIDLEPIHNRNITTLESITNALYSANFWNSIFQFLRPFFGLPPTDILQIEENRERQKRQSYYPPAPTETPSSVNQIISQLMPATATPAQQDEMRKCIDETTVELQNLLHQFRTACSNIRDGFSVGAPSNCKNGDSSACQNHSFMQSAPVLIQSILDNPEQIGQIPDILQSSVPATQMVNSVDNLRDSLQKMFGLLQQLNSESEDSSCEDEEDSESSGRKKKVKKINKHLNGWKSKKSRKHGNQFNPNSGKNQPPNTVILTIPSTQTGSPCTTSSQTPTPSYTAQPAAVSYPSSQSATASYSLAYPTPGAYPPATSITSQNPVYSNDQSKLNYMNYPSNLPYQSTTPQESTQTQQNTPAYQSNIAYASNSAYPSNSAYSNSGAYPNNNVYTSNSISSSNSAYSSSNSAYPSSNSAYPSGNSAYPSGNSAYSSSNSAYPSSNSPYSSGNGNPSASTYTSDSTYSTNPPYSLNPTYQSSTPYPNYSQYAGYSTYASSSYPQYPSISTAAQTAISSPAVSVPCTGNKQKLSTISHPWHPSSPWPIVSISQISGSTSAHKPCSSHTTSAHKPWSSKAKTGHSHKHSGSHTSGHLTQPFLHSKSLPQVPQHPSKPSPVHPGSPISQCPSKPTPVHPGSHHICQYPSKPSPVHPEPCSCQYPQLIHQPHVTPIPIPHFPYPSYQLTPQQLYPTIESEYPCGCGLPHPPEQPCNHLKSTDSHKSKDNEPSKSKSKFGKFLSLRHITQRSYGSDCESYSESIRDSNGLNRAGIQVLQADDPSSLKVTSTNEEPALATFSPYASLGEPFGSTGSAVVESGIESISILPPKSSQNSDPEISTKELWYQTYNTPAQNDYMRSSPRVYQDTSLPCGYNNIPTQPGYSNTNLQIDTHNGVQNTYYGTTSQDKYPSQPTYSSYLSTSSRATASSSCNQYPNGQLQNGHYNTMQAGQFISPLQSSHSTTSSQIGQPTIANQNTHLNDRQNTNLNSPSPGIVSNTLLQNQYPGSFYQDGYPNFSPNSAIPNGLPNSQSQNGHINLPAQHGFNSISLQNGFSNSGLHNQHSNNLQSEHSTEPPQDTHHHGSSQSENFNILPQSGLSNSGLHNQHSNNHLQSELLTEPSQDTSHHFSSQNANLNIHLQSGFSDSDSQNDHTGSFPIDHQNENSQGAHSNIFSQNVHPHNPSQSRPQSPIQTEHEFSQTNPENSMSEHEASVLELGHVPLTSSINRIQSTMDSRSFPNSQNRLMNRQFNPIQNLGSTIYETGDALTGVTPLIHTDHPNGEHLQNPGHTASSVGHALNGVTSNPSDDESAFNRVHSPVSTTGHTFHGVTPTITPSSSAHVSPLRNLGSTTSAVGDAISGASFFANSDSDSDESTLQKTGSTTSTVGNVISGVSSLIPSDSTGNALERVGTTAAAFGDAVEGVSTLLNPESAHVFGSAVSILVEALTDASTLLRSNINHNAGLNAGSTTSAIADTISGASTLMDQSFEGNSALETAAARIADSVVAAASLLQAQMQQRQQQRANQISALPKSTTSDEAAGSTTSTVGHVPVGTFGSSIPSRISQNNSNSPRHDSTNTFFDASSIPSVDASNSAVTSIRNSLSSMVNSAAVVADSLSSVISRLAEQNLRSSESTPVTTPTPSDISSPALVNVPLSFDTPVDLPQSIYVYRPNINNFKEQQISLTVPRDKVCAAIDGGILLPGDVIIISLNQQSALVGKVTDTVSPISFDLIQRNNWESSTVTGNNMWRISSTDCKDSELQRVLQEISRHIA